MAHEYGWSLDQIFNLTIHEINWLMSAINTRTGQELKFQASLHGVKLKNNSRIFSNDNAKINLTTDQQKKLDEIIKKRISQGRIDGGTNKN